MAVKASATITLIRVDDGDPGANAITGYLTNEAIPVPASPTGVVSSLTHANGTFKIMDGNTVATSGISFTKGAETGMVTTINATTGYYSISSMSADFGSVTYSAVYKNVTVQKILIAVKNKQGVQGTGISSTVINYATSTSGTVIPTSGWGTTIPSVSANQYLWTRTTINYTSGNPSVSYAIGLMGAQGPIGQTGPTGLTGPTGQPGAAGRGISSTTITYAASASGTATPTSWSSTIPSVSPSQYLWSRTVLTYTSGTPATTTSYSVGRIGEQGPQGIQGPQGAKGATGPTGPPTGITESTTIPASPYTGMLWRHTGTVSGYITGATYRYNGSAWALYLFHADNISATNLAAITANLGTVTAGIVKSSDSSVELNLGTKTLKLGDKFNFDGSKLTLKGDIQADEVIRLFSSSGKFSSTLPGLQVIPRLTSGGGTLFDLYLGHDDNSSTVGHDRIYIGNPNATATSTYLGGVARLSSYMELKNNTGVRQMSPDGTLRIDMFRGTDDWLHINYSAQGRTKVYGNLEVGGGIFTDGREVLSYGNNTNGHWIKMYDGTLICWGRERRNVPVSTANGSIFRSAQINYTYPAAFVGAYPHVTISAYDAMTALMELESRTAFGVMLFKGTSNTNLGTQISWQAIGRWY